MPPQDHAGNFLMRPMRYLRMVTAVCTLVGVLAGGAIGFWSHAAAAGRADAENAQLRLAVQQLAGTVKDLVTTVQNIDRRTYVLELRAGTASYSK